MALEEEFVLLGRNLDKIFHFTYVRMIWQSAHLLLEGKLFPRFFSEKLFPDIYPLKWKYIYPW